MSSTSVQEFQETGNLIVKNTIKIAKNNPIKISSYLLGILVFLFATGYNVKPERYKDFESKIVESRMKTFDVLDAKTAVENNRRIYRRSKGWFTCNQECQNNLSILKISEQQYASFKKEEDIAVRDAKSTLGIFSKYGVEEVRSLFWQKFSHGNEFSTRQTKWDAMFITFSAIGRDEKLMNYVIRIFIQFIFNFTIGVIFALVYFIFRY